MMRTRLKHFEHLGINKTADSYIVHSITVLGEQRGGAIAYKAPFDRCDRETDYATAWSVFEKKVL